MAITFADKNQLKQPAYNLHSYFLSAGMVTEEICKTIPGFEYNYEPQENIETLLSGWPDIVMDDQARKDWGWDPQYNFEQSAQWMFEFLMK